MRSDGIARRSNDVLSFIERSDGRGFSIVDHADRHQCHIRTAGPITPTERDADQFGAPIDRAVTIDVESLTVPHTLAVYVRDSDGRLIEPVSNESARQFSDGRYQIEFTTPIKLYLFLTGAFEIDTTPEQVTIDFQDRTRVTLGMRTPHESPHSTITTTDDPADLAAAISHFGSALKTTTCERSYPTLRGHPPEVRQGADLSIPEQLRRPETGVTIRVRPRLEQLVTVATLAYYLGAGVKIGGPARIQTASGFVHELEQSSRGFVAEVDRVLKQSFFLDCITRTEGLYQFDLNERRCIEDAVDLDFESLYEMSLSAQLERYLSVPYDVLESEIPQWQFTAHVHPTTEYLEVLPFVAYDMATIRPHQGHGGNDTPAPELAAEFGIEEFLRRDGPDESAFDAGVDRSVVSLEPTDALADVWFGRGFPVGASKGVAQAYRNRFGRSPSDGNIDIKVIVNDSKMVAEGRAVDDVAGTREDLSFEVDVYRHVTRAGFERLLSSGMDFLHYIGHIDERGFECADGWLDVSALEETSVDSFLLNACESYEQGMALLETGAIAGVVTSSPVSNEEARVVGKRIAKLLNLGFPFYAAVDVATIDRGEELYEVVGDPGMSITHTEGGVADMCDLQKTQDGYQVSYFTFPTRKHSIGSIATKEMEGSSIYYLASGTLFQTIYEDKQVSEFLSLGELPTVLNSEFQWSSELVNGEYFNL